MADDIRIATFALGQRGGEPAVEVYQAGAIYSIDDLNPWLCIGFVENWSAKQMGKQKVGSLERYQNGPADGLHWWGLPVPGFLSANHSAIFLAAGRFAP
jgi:hypothetical protein